MKRMTLIQKLIIQTCPHQRHTLTGYASLALTSYCSRAIIDSKSESQEGERASNEHSRGSVISEQPRVIDPLSAEVHTTSPSFSYWQVSSSCSTQNPLDRYSSSNVFESKASSISRCQASLFRCILLQSSAWVNRSEAGPFSSHSKQQAIDLPAVSFACVCFANSRLYLKVYPHHPY